MEISLCISGFSPALHAAHDLLRNLTDATPYQSGDVCAHQPRNLVGNLNKTNPMNYGADPWIQ